MRGEARSEAGRPRLLAGVESRYRAVSRHLSRSLFFVDQVRHNVPSASASDILDQRTKNMDNHRISREMNWRERADAAREAGERGDHARAEELYRGALEIAEGF